MARRQPRSLDRNGAITLQANDDHLDCGCLPFNEVIVPSSRRDHTCASESVKVPLTALSRTNEVLTKQASHQYAIAGARPKRRCLMKSANVDAAPEGAASFSAAASSGCLCQALRIRCFVIGNIVSRLPIALKIALAMAGGIGPIVGSPAPHAGVSGDCVSCSG